MELLGLRTMRQGGKDNITEDLTKDVKFSAQVTKSRKSEEASDIAVTFPGLD